MSRFRRVLTIALVAGLLLGTFALGAAFIFMGSLVVANRYDVYGQPNVMRGHDAQFRVWAFTNDPPGPLVGGSVTLALEGSDVSVTEKVDKRGEATLVVPIPANLPDDTATFLATLQADGEVLEAMPFEVQVVSEGFTTATVAAKARDDLGEGPLRIELLTDYDFVVPQLENDVFVRVTDRETWAPVEARVTMELDYGQVIAETRYEVTTNALGIARMGLRPLSETDWKLRATDIHTADAASDDAPEGAPATETPGDTQAEGTSPAASPEDAPTDSGPAGDAGTLPVPPTPDASADAPSTEGEEPPPGPGEGEVRLTLPVYATSLVVRPRTRLLRAGPPLRIGVETTRSGGELFTDFISGGTWLSTHHTKIGDTPTEVSVSTRGLKAPEEPQLATMVSCFSAISCDDANARAPMVWTPTRLGDEATLRAMAGFVEGQGTDTDYIRALRKRLDGEKVDGDALELTTEAMAARVKTTYHKPEALLRSEPIAAARLEETKTRFRQTFNFLALLLGIAGAIFLGTVVFRATAQRRRAMGDVLLDSIVDDGVDVDEIDLPAEQAHAALKGARRQGLAVAVDIAVLLITIVVFLGSMLLLLRQL